MPNPWVALLVSIIGGAFTVVLFPLVREHLRRRWMADPGLTSAIPSSACSKSRQDHGERTPPLVMSLRRELIGEYKRLGREMLRTQLLSEADLSVAVAALNRTKFRGDVLRWLADWMTKNPPISDQTAVFRHRLLESVRETAIAYIDRDAVLWRELSSPYVSTTVTGMIDLLRRSQPNLQMLSDLEAWYEQS